MTAKEVLAIAKVILEERIDPAMTIIIQRGRFEIAVTWHPPGEQVTRYIQRNMM
jgi:hypothetical protein